VTVEDSDDELLAQVAHGDGVAFARLVQRHRGRVMALSARITGNRATAEEIVQETFTRVWINASRWRPQKQDRATFASWLSRVATNLSIDQARKTRTLPLDAAPEPIDTADRADARLIGEERMAKFQTALQALPSRQRAALALTYDEGLSNAEGAAAMRTSVGAFELLLVRARRSLRLAMMEGDDA
jgi:RNA polymerase sigma-70 factor (ECF subfamily)